VERLGNEVRRSLRGAGVPDAGLLAEVTRAWPGAVGPGIAGAAWPSRIARDGTLHVATVSSVWAFELQRMEADVRERLAAGLAGDVPPRLAFAVGHVPAAGPDEAGGATAPAAPPSPESLESAAELAAAVEDEALRDLVRRAAAASLERERHDRRF
jgi:hypothetical protein